IDHLRIARGQYVISIEKEGYAPLERTISGAIPRFGNGMFIPPALRIEEKLIEAAKLPNRMTFVPGGEYKLVNWARPTDASLRLDAYFIDKFEVANREYKEFITAGGYL